MAITEPIGLTLAGQPGGDALPVFMSSSGVPAFEASAPYLMSDGNSLAAPVLAYDAGGPVGVDSVGGPVSALAVSMDSAPVTPAWSPFTLTAGDSGEWFGYSSGDLASPPFNPPVGSISSEPNSQHQLLAMYVDLDDGAPVAIFHGDIQAAAAGLGLQINAYQGSASEISPFAGSTVVRFSPAASDMTDGQTYGVVFTPMES